MNICVFASGSGTNFKAILRAKRKGIIKSDISLLISNNSNCGAFNIALKNNIHTLHISRKKYPLLNDEEYTNLFIDALKRYNIELIALAGYMKMIDRRIVRLYDNRIINIHPALLPSFGGEGMFGINVHRAVIKAGVKISGLTIHFVNEEYDKGKIIFQKAVKVKDNDDEYTLQKRILKYEHIYYPYIIKKIESGEIKIGI